MSEKCRNLSKNVFDHAKMKKYLPRKTFQAVLKAENGEKLSWQDTQNYAKGLLKWAKSVGATCYSHRFDPFGHGTSEKINQWLTNNLQGDIFEKFGAEQLSFSECDASAFSNGKMPFDAKGEIHWFAAAPPYVTNKCLCIPSVLSCEEGALDEKVPLFRSCKVLNDSAKALLGALDMPCERVLAVVGAEQEYFLLDKHKYLQCPDLVTTGKLLMPCSDVTDKNKRNYCTPPSKKVDAFQRETKRRLLELGIVAKTQHGEVAPCQFELAPCCAPAVVAFQQNNLIKQTLAEVAEELNLVCLFHEKPFSHVNGSGMHNNWSLCTEKNENLFERGNTAKHNARYTILLACVVRAVDLHQSLLLASAASASNDCRLGRCEAPPKIISVALGSALDDLIQASDENFKLADDLLGPQRPFVRNRTSPLAFTQNKFEFRLVGSSATTADCNIAINCAVAETFFYLADKLNSSSDVWKDAKLFVTETLQQHGRILFDGDNYSEAWQAAASKRKLFLPPSTPELFALSPKDKQLLQNLCVANNFELNAKQCAMQTNYCNQLENQATVLLELYEKHLVPTLHKLLIRQAKIATVCTNADVAKIEEKRQKKLTTCAKNLYTCSKKLKNCLKNAPTEISVRANFFAKSLQSEMDSMEKQIATFHAICPAKLWPFACERLLSLDEDGNR